MNSKVKLTIFFMLVSTIGLLSQEKNTNMLRLTSSLSGVVKSMMDDKSSKLLLCPTYIDSKDVSFDNFSNTISVYGFGVVRGNDINILLEDAILSIQKNNFILISSPLYYIDMYCVMEKQMNDKVGMMLVVHKNYIAISFPKLDSPNGARVWYKLSENSLKVFNKQFVKAPVELKK